MPTQPLHSDANSPPHCREINNKYVVSPPLASFISPDMDDPSSSLLDFDFGAGFDVSEDDAFDDFDADFGRAFDFGDALDAASCNFDGSVTAEVDVRLLGISLKTVVAPALIKGKFAIPTMCIVLRASQSRHGTGILLVRG